MAQDRLDIFVNLFFTENGRDKLDTLRASFQQFVGKTNEDLDTLKAKMAEKREVKFDIDTTNFEEHKADVLEGVSVIDGLLKEKRQLKIDTEENLEKENELLRKRIELVDELENKNRLTKKEQGLLSQRTKRRDQSDDAVGEIAGNLSNIDKEIDDLKKLKITFNETLTDIDEDKKRFIEGKKNELQFRIKVDDEGLDKIVKIRSKLDNFSRQIYKAEADVDVDHGIRNLQRLRKEAHKVLTDDVDRKNFDKDISDNLIQFMDKKNKILSFKGGRVGPGDNLLRFKEAIDKIGISYDRSAFAARVFSIAIERSNDTTEDAFLHIRRLAQVAAGLRIAFSIAFIAPLLNGLIALGGAFVAVASSAVMAGAAVGGAFVAGLAQAIPALGLIAAVALRLGQVFQYVQTRQQLLKTNFGRNDAEKRQTDATERITDAQDALAASTTGVEDATRNLKKAREEARRELDDLVLAEQRAKFEAEGAVLSQEEAQRALRKAIAEGDVAGISRADLGLRQSGVDVQASEIQARRAKQAAQEARAAGEDGSERVKDATRQLDQARASADNARRGLAKAREEAKGAGDSTLAAARNLQFLRKQLSEEEIHLALVLTRLQREFRKVTAPITNIFITGFTHAINRIRKLIQDPELFSAFQGLSIVASKALGQIFDEFTSDKTRKQFVRLINSLIDNIGPITRIFISLGRIFLGIAEAASPALNLMLKWIQAFTSDLADDVEKNRSGITRFFIDAAHHARSWFVLLLSIIELLAAIVGVAAPDGQDAIVGLTQKIREATNFIRNNHGEVRKFFRDSIEATVAILRLAFILSAALIKAFNADIVKDFAKFLEIVVLPPLGLLLHYMEIITGVVFKFFTLPGVSTAARLFLFLALVASLVRGAQYLFAILTGSVLRGGLGVLKLLSYFGLLNKGIDATNSKLIRMIELLQRARGPLPTGGGPGGTAGPTPVPTPGPTQKRQPGDPPRETPGQKTPIVAPIPGPSEGAISKLGRFARIGGGLLLTFAAINGIFAEGGLKGKVDSFFDTLTFGALGKGDDALEKSNNLLVKLKAIKEKSGFIEKFQDLGRKINPLLGDDPEEKRQKDATKLLDIVKEIPNADEKRVEQLKRQADVLTKNLELTDQERGKIAKLIVGRERILALEKETVAERNRRLRGESRVEGFKTGQDLSSKVFADTRITSNEIDEIKAKLETLPPEGAKAALKTIKNIGRTFVTNGTLANTDLKRLMRRLGGTISGIEDRGAKSAATMFLRMASVFETGLSGLTGGTSRGIKAIDKVLKDAGEALGFTAPNIKTHGKAEKITIDLLGLGTGIVKAVGAVTSGEFAEGGWVGGSGMMDSILAMVAPGEAVVNRHQQVPIDHALQQVYGYGLDELFNRIKTPHYMAGGGKFSGPFGSGEGFTPWSNFASQRFRLSVSSGRTNHSTNVAGTNRPSDHSVGLANDYSNGVLTPSEDAFNSFIKARVPQVVKQLIWRNRDQFQGFPIGGHLDHVHLALKPPYAFDAIRMAKILGRAGKGLNISKLLTASNDAVQSVPQVPQIEVDGPKGFITSAVRSVINKVRRGANRFLRRKGGDDLSLLGGSASLKSFKHHEGSLGRTDLSSLWRSGGGDPRYANLMARVALAESGGNPDAQNPSGATGLWQILGAVIRGNLKDPTVNVRNAIKKFNDARKGGGDPLSPWYASRPAWGKYRPPGLSRGGMIPKFARGGFVGLPRFAGGTGGISTTDASKLTKRDRRIESLLDRFANPNLDPLEGFTIIIRALGLAEKSVTKRQANIRKVLSQLTDETGPLANLSDAFTKFSDNITEGINRVSFKLKGKGDRSFVNSLMDDVEKSFRELRGLMQQTDFLEDARKEDLRLIRKLRQVRSEAKNDKQRNLAQGAINKVKENIKEIDKNISQNLSDRAAKQVELVQSLIEKVNEEAEKNLSVARSDEVRDVIQKQLTGLEALKTTVSKLDPKSKKQLQNQIVELQRGMADAVVSASERRLRAADRALRVGDLTPGNAGFGVKAQALGERGIQLTRQRDELGGIRDIAARSHNNKLVEELNDQIAELDVQLQENSKAIRDNTNAQVAAAIESTTSRQGFLGGVLGSLKTIVEAFGEISPAGVDNGLLISIATKAVDTVGGSLDTLLRNLGQFFPELGLNLEGLSGDKLVEAILGALPLIDTFITQLKQSDPGRADTLEGLINSILGLGSELETNTAALNELTGATKKPQEFSTTAWKDFRMAIFDGLSGVLPQFTEPSFQSSSFNTPQITVQSTSSDKIVKSGDTNVYITNPTETADPEYIASRIAWQQKTNANLR